MNKARRAFTLIELLVVIAIIAILAAILFPVFASAKIAAKKAVYISNIKQIGLSTQIYLADYDDTFPMGFGQRPSGTWGISVGHPVPWDDIPSLPAGVWNTPARMEMAHEMSFNAIQPYAHNYGVLNLPVAQNHNTFGDTFSGPEGPASVGMNYNGEFHTLPASSVPAPSTAVLLWAVEKYDGLGRGFPSPTLNCGGGTPGVPSTCLFNPGGQPYDVPAGVCGGAGVYDCEIVFDFTGTTWLFDKKMVIGRADSSAKVVPVGTVISPLAATQAGSIVDPWINVGPDGSLALSLGSYTCGPGGVTDLLGAQYLCYFRPDRLN